MFQLLLRQGQGSLGRAAVVRGWADVWAGGGVMSSPTHVGPGGAVDMGGCSTSTG